MTTDTDPGIEALRAKHQPRPLRHDFPDVLERCDHDGESWPCSTARLFAERDAAIADADEAWITVTRWESEALAMRSALDAVRWGFGERWERFCRHCRGESRPSGFRHGPNCLIGPLFGEACDAS